MMLKSAFIKHYQTKSESICVTSVLRVQTAGSAHLNFHLIQEPENDAGVKLHV